MSQMPQYRKHSKKIFIPIDFNNQNNKTYKSTNTMKATKNIKQVCQQRIFAILSFVLDNGRNLFIDIW